MTDTTDDLGSTLGASVTDADVLALLVNHH
jgi:hypothetical protein